MIKKTIFSSDDRIAASILTALNAGLISMSEAVRRSEVGKNKFFRSVACMIHLGIAPDNLLRFKSISDIYEQYDTVNGDDGLAGTADNSLSRMREKLAAAQRRATEAERQLDAELRLMSAVDAIADAPVESYGWTGQVIGSHSGNTPSTPIVVLTDWHLGEVVRPGEAGGYAYNTAIAKSRVQTTVTRTIELTRQSFSDLEYPGIICCLGGDFVGGAIHSELAETDDMSILASAIAARDLVINAVEQFAEEFGRVFVPCAVGNHGRIFDRRPRAKGYSERNADWLIHKLIADHFKNDDRVSVVVPDSGETHFNVFGKSFLLTHGDQLGTKGGDGIIGAIGPIMRGSMKTLESLSSIGKPVDHLIIGHWHQSIDLNEVTVCGSLKGPDEYAMRMLRAPAQDPSQKLIIVHPDYGITFRNNIFLDDEHCPVRDKAAKRSTWVSVFAEDAN